MFKESKLPKGIPCLGVVDVTEMYYKERKELIRDGYEIFNVQNNGKDVEWQVFHSPVYKDPFCDESNSKLFLIVYSEGKEADGEISIQARKRINPYFIKGSLRKKVLEKPVNLPFVEKQNQENVVDKFRFYNAMEWFKKNKEKENTIIDNCFEWCMALRAEKDKVAPDFEKLYKNYYKNINEKELTSEQKARIFISNSKYYYIYDGNMKKEMLENTVPPKQWTL
ncbi:MAG: hypothetical protein V1752_04170 [Candidatus Firestonebacteria bacterium]